MVTRSPSSASLLLNSSACAFKPPCRSSSPCAKPRFWIIYQRGTAKWFVDKHTYWIEMMGRLRPGVSLAQAQAELEPAFHAWVMDSAENDGERAVGSLTLGAGGRLRRDSLRRQYSKPLVVLMTMVGLILLIACANVANFLLARAEARRAKWRYALSLGAGAFASCASSSRRASSLALCGAASRNRVLALRHPRPHLAPRERTRRLHLARPTRLAGLTFTLLVALC